VLGPLSSSSDDDSGKEGALRIAYSPAPASYQALPKGVGLAEEGTAFT